eukprot:scaffold29296_cov144-Isochrysis_galbana.AAC.1
MSCELWQPAPARVCVGPAATPERELCFALCALLGVARTHEEAQAEDRRAAATKTGRHSRQGKQAAGSLTMMRASARRQRDKRWAGGRLDLGAIAKAYKDRSAHRSLPPAWPCINGADGRILYGGQGAVPILLLRPTRQGTRPCTCLRCIGGPP